LGGLVGLGKRQPITVWIEEHTADQSAPVFDLAHRLLQLLVAAVLHLTIG
jgi:hypothetical protein